MKSIFRNCIYQGKNLFRDRGFLFWSLLYPIIMAIFFNTAFSGMMDMELTPINVGISTGNPIEYILEEVEILKIHHISGDEMEDKLRNEEIAGFIDDDMNLKVRRSGLYQTIIKEVLDQIKQTFNLNVPFERLDFDTNYVRSSNQKSNSIMVIFYSLIGMVSTYGVYGGIEVVSIIQANLSPVGQRINITPLRKNEFLLAGTIVCLLLNLISNGILLIFIRYILKINLFTEIKYTAALIFLGNLFGISLGMLIGISNKQNSNVKSLIAIMITLSMSFLSGMMSPYIKLLVDKNMPLIGRINPVSIITNNLYRINLLGSTQSAREGIIILLVYIMAITTISYIFLRRKTYDSI